MLLSWVHPIVAPAAVGLKKKQSVKCNCSMLIFSSVHFTRSAPIDVVIIRTHYDISLPRRDCFITGPNVYNKSLNEYEVSMVRSFSRFQRTNVISSNSSVLRRTLYDLRNRRQWAHASRKRQVVNCRHGDSICRQA